MNAAKIKETVFGIAPGFIVCVIIAFLSKGLAHFAPTLGAATIAIFVGMFVGNTFGNKEIFNKGTKFSEGTLLSISVVFLGGTLSISTIMTLGFSGVAFIALQMVITIVAAIYIGKKLGFSENFRLLMASGNAVCGSSAIASTAPAIGASDKDKGIAITMVNVLGTILMLLLPVIANFMYSLETMKTSALIGGTLQSVGQVVASAKMINPEVTEFATIFKIVRIIFLVFVVIAFSYMKEDKNKKISKTKELDIEIKDSYGNDEKEIAIGEVNAKEKRRMKLNIPWYVIGFFILCGLFSIGLIPMVVSKTLKLFSNNFEVIALAGIGMRVKFRDLLAQGIKVSSYALLIGVVQVVSAIALIALILN